MRESRREDGNDPGVPKQHRQADRQRRIWIGHEHGKPAAMVYPLHDPKKIPSS
jgi:hypothetical protein